MSDVTRILSQIEEGDPRATENLLPLVYDELRKLAAAKLAREKPGRTLQATARVRAVMAADPVDRNTSRDMCVFGVLDVSRSADESSTYVWRVAQAVKRLTMCRFTIYDCVGVESRQ